MSRKGYVTWLKVASILAIGFGLASSLASFEGGSGIWLFLFDILRWPVDGLPESFDANSYALNAVLGGVMAGWGILLYLLANGPIAEGDHRMANYMLISLDVWFVVDSIGSVVAGIPGNVILNLSFLVIFGIPLLVLRKPETESLTANTVNS